MSISVNFFHNNIPFCSPLCQTLQGHACCSLVGWLYPFWDVSPCWRQTLGSEACCRNSAWPPNTRIRGLFKWSQFFSYPLFSGVSLKFGKGVSDQMLRALYWIWTTFFKAMESFRRKVKKWRGEKRSLEVGACNLATATTYTILPILHTHASLCL